MLLFSRTRQEMKIRKKQSGRVNGKAKVEFSGLGLYIFGKGMKEKGGDDTEC